MEKTDKCFDIMGNILNSKNIFTLNCQDSCCHKKELKVFFSLKQIMSDFINVPVKKLHPILNNRQFCCLIGKSGLCILLITNTYSVLEQMSMILKDF